VKETSDSTINEEQVENLSAEAKTSWLRSKLWGAPPTVSSATIERKRAAKLFRKSMQSFSLYEDEPSKLDENIGKSSTDLVPHNSNAAIESSAASIEGNDIADDIHKSQDNKTIPTKDNGSAAEPYDTLPDAAASSQEQ
jgi:hypothetical protein